MLLQNKNAVIYGGGGAIGGAVAKALAREGARVHLAGRNRARLDTVAAAIKAAGGSADISLVDARDEAAVAAHADAVAAEAGGIDIALNAIGIHHVQGVGLLDLSLADFSMPVRTYIESNYVTARAVARHMVRQKAGVIFTLSTPGSKWPGPGYINYGVACAGVEGLTRLLAGELGPSGVRSICLRAHAIPEAMEAGSHSRDVFAPMAAQAGISMAEMMAGCAETTLLKRLPTLAEIGNMAAFLASDQAAILTGAVVNLNAGAVVD